jgi:hypothetical protein
MLRSRKSRREVPLDAHVPEPIVSREDRIDPEHEALLADSIGLALLLVLETLAPAERLGFVLHDMFAVPFDEIAAIVGAPRPRPGSSQAARAAGCKERPRFPPPISAASEKWSTPSSTDPRESSPLTRVDGRFPSWASRSGTGGSSKSTCSPTPRASPSSTWGSSTADEPTCDALLAERDQEATAKPDRAAS